MRVLFDLVHPAHVHFARHLIAELDGAGHDTFVVAREKDVTTSLLDHFEIPYVTVGRAGSGSLPTMAWELVRRDVALARTARKVRADVIVTRNPAGVQAARLARVRGVFDTDDGKEVGIHFRAAAPFAHTITTPDCIRDQFGAKHVKYPSYKSLAFLHPDRFTPDRSVLGELGVSAGERFFIVRLVALAASHDRGASGLDHRERGDLIERLQRFGRVFVSSESSLPADLSALALPTAPHRLHDALAFASLCVTDGQSMAGEAAVLGVPSVRFASTSGRLDVFRELGDRYGLVFEFGPGEQRDFFETVERVASADDPTQWRDRREQLLADKCDLTSWFAEFLTAMPAKAAV